MKIRPIAVVQVAGQQHELHALGQRQIDQVFQRPARRVAQPLHRRTGIAAQAAQRAVDVQVSGVDETEAARGFHYSIHSAQCRWNMRRRAFIKRQKSACNWRLRFAYVWT